MMIDQIRHLSHQLRLFGIHSGFERRAEEALSKQLHPTEFLRLVLEDELLARKDRTAKALITKARFRKHADIEDWDDSFDRGLTKQKLKELSSLAFYHSTENLIILGKTGEGKSHLAVALGRLLCRESVSTAFIPINFLFEEIQAARVAGRYLPYLRKLNAAKALILDDFGLRNYTHDEATVLIDILEDRYQRGIVVITSQVDPKGWNKLFEDALIAEAIVDRLTNPSNRVVLKGGSYREKLKPTAKKLEEKPSVK